MIHHFWVFALASLLLNLTPGNDMLYVASRSMGQGTKAGIVSALGIMVGCLVHVLAATVGLSALIAESASAFTIIKYVGAAYLVYLGLRALLNRKEPALLGKKEDKGPVDQKRPGAFRKIFTQGVLTCVLNPKVALFFLAFLPQFVDTHAPQLHLAILLLGIWFDTGATIVNVLVAIGIGRMSGWLSRSPRFLRIQEKITGLVLIGLGLKIALTSKK